MHDDAPRKTSKRELSKLASMFDGFLKFDVSPRARLVSTYEYRCHMVERF